MSRKSFVIVFSVLMALIVALAWWAISDAETKTWDVCYPMANQHIEWTGAGYSGIYGR